MKKKKLDRAPNRQSDLDLLQHNRPMIEKIEEMAEKTEYTQKNTTVISKYDKNKTPVAPPDLKSGLNSPKNEPTLSAGPT